MFPNAVFQSFSLTGFVQLGMKDVTSGFLLLSIYMFQDRNESRKPTNLSNGTGICGFKASKYAENYSERTRINSKYFSVPLTQADHY